VFSITANLTIIKKDLLSNKVQTSSCKRIKVVILKKGPTKHNFHLYYGLLTSLHFDPNSWYWKDGTPFITIPLGKSVGY
jgi:hypothetical protein